MIQLALNQNTCKNHALIQFLKLSKKIKSVELNFNSIRKTLTNNINIKTISEILETRDISISSIFALKDFSLCSDWDYKTKILLKFNQMINYCYKLESNLLIVNPSFLENKTDLNEIPQWRIVNRTIKRLKDLSKKANEYDIKIGFEFLSDSSISTLSNAKEVVGSLESLENLGYIIDMFHFIKSKAEPEQLKDIKRFIFLIQLADLKYDSLEKLSLLKDSNRVFPGEGNFDMKKFLFYLNKIGYNKLYSIELSKNECNDYFFYKFSKYLKTFY